MTTWGSGSPSKCPERSFFSVVAVGCTNVSPASTSKMLSLVIFLLSAACSRYDRYPHDELSAKTLAKLSGGIEVPFPPSFSADGSIVVFGGRVGNQDWLYVNSERRYGPFACVCGPVVSANGSKTVFVAPHDGREAVILDGVAVRRMILLLGQCP
jgi:hypothetical protein